MELLKQLYYDSETGLLSKDKLYRKAKAIDNNITLKVVKEFLDKQATAQITQQVVKNKTYDTIISPSVRNNYQADIMYLPHPTLNKGYKYLLTCIDVNSRYAFVEPLKSKTGPVVFEAFGKMMKEHGRPNNLNIDDGAEFNYKPFKKYCEDNHIVLWISNPEQSNKNAIIERFHRTLRNIILRYEVAFNKSYIGEMSKFLRNYNSTYHKTIETTPISIWEGKEKNIQPITYTQNDFKVGDEVRHKTIKGTFDKGSSTTNYTKTVYKITRIEGKSIYLDDLTKPFKSFELVKAVGETIETKFDKKIVEELRKETIKRRMNKEGLS